MFHVASPFWLLGLLPVVVVAGLTYLRPARRRMVVGSLALWKQATARAGITGKEHSRRMPRGWLLLLAGAVLGVAALSQPVYVANPPARWIAVGVCLSAETGGSVPSLAQKVELLLDRLSPDDRIQLIWPADFGEPKVWRGPGETRDELKRLQSGLLPIISSPKRPYLIHPSKPANELLPLPPANEAAQQTVWFVPAGAESQDGPSVHVIEYPYQLPDVTFDALAGETTLDGQVEIFVRLRNNTRSPWRGTVGATVFPQNDVTRNSFSIPAREAKTLILTVPKGEQILLTAGTLMKQKGTVRVEGSDLLTTKDFEEVAGVAGWLQRVPEPTVRVAVVGQPSTVIQRYIQADSLLELVGDVRDADVVIANGVEVVGRKPVLMIAPPKPPAGWTNAPPVRNLIFDQVSVASDDPVMRNADIASMAVRIAQPWRSEDISSGKPLVLLNDMALLLRTTPETSRESIPSRRVYVAFDLSDANTNIVENPAPFITLLANSVRWLSMTRSGQAKYVFSPSYKPTKMIPGSDILHFLPLGLRQHEPKIPVAKAVAELALPAPRPSERDIFLWPWIAATAGLCWIVGWMRTG